MLIGISSPGGENNFYTILVNLVDDEGKPLFLVYKQIMVCDLCKRRPNMIECRHKIKEVPPWKSVRGMNLTLAVMGQADRTDDVLQESLCVKLHDFITFRNDFFNARMRRGMSGKNAGGVFPIEYLQRLQNQVRLEDLTTIPMPKWVVLGCDPNRGGMDHAAFTLTALIQNQVWVRRVGAEPCESLGRLRLRLHIPPGAFPRAFVKTASSTCTRYV